ncbi:ATP-dependent metallopeptidase FtsH/Yme1/Tma family protein [Alkaliphilus serpentinus]|nr:FtsH/Yme1/Tma family ATP-dependent metallopeptidase [Alkaliphilus serpentinus]
MIKKRKKQIIGLMIALLIVGMIATLYYFKYMKVETINLSYNDFLMNIEGSNIKKVYLSDGANIEGILANGQAFITDNPRKEDLKEVLLKHSIEVEEVNQEFSAPQLISFVVFITVLSILAIYLSKKNTNQASKEYDKMSSVDYSTKREKQIAFSSVAGNQEAKESLLELVDFLKHPDKYRRYGARMPRGVILYGPPGTGKTLMAKALASEAGVDFMAVSGSDFVQIYVGVGAARIRSLFKKASEKKKCVIFIDEIDALGKKRDRGMGGSDESDRTLNALLTEMSGFKDNDGIIVLAATNRLDTLDDALLRPGRFDRQIEVGLPDLQARREILELYTQNRPVSTTVDIGQLAQQTVYFSGAKLENLMNEAAIYAARENTQSIMQNHIDKAFYKVIAGEEKKDRGQISIQERKITAYHEAGHTVATKLLCPLNKVTKVTIIPSTNGAGGFSMNIPPDRMFHTKKDMLDNIKIALAGRAVEELIFGKDNITTGASNDIQKATETLVVMMKRFGMSEKLGMLNYDILMGQQGADQGFVKECNETMDQLYRETREMLKKNMHLVEGITIGLLERETLNEGDIDQIIQETH